MNTKLTTILGWTTTLILAAASGCGTSDDSMQPDVDPEDTTPPTVIVTSPSTGATGIAAGENIVVTFSEPMDRATVEAAYHSQQLPSDQVSMAWNAELTQLTISPNQPLAYSAGTGTDPSTVAAFTFAIQIGADAADLAGNPLGTAMDLSFATKRRMTAAFGLDLDFTRVTLTISSLSGTEIFIGDTSSKNPYRSYLTFDLSSLPADAVIEDAYFDARQLPSDGAPYTIGGVRVEHVTFTAVSAGFLTNAPTLSAPGMFSEDGTVGTKSIGVTAQVVDDVANRVERGDRSQYRLLIDQGTNDDDVTDRAVFAKDTFQLSATYVVD